MFYTIVRRIYNRATNKIPKNLTFKDLSHYYPEIKKGRVIKVYDGDSITIAARVPKLRDRKIYKFNIRLNRIDCPEIKTKNTTEKELGLRIRDILSEKIMNKMVNLNIIKTDKYGRYLAEVFYKKENINSWLLNNRYAVQYDGGKKEEFSTLPYNSGLLTPINPRLDKVVTASIIRFDEVPLDDDVPVDNVPIYDEGNERCFIIS